MRIAIFLKFGSTYMRAVDQNHNYKLEWPSQLTHTYTVGQSATVVKILTRVLPLTYCEFVLFFTVDFLDFPLKLLGLITPVQ